MVYWRVAALMLLPYPLDLLPSVIGRGLSRLRGWHPVGKRVRLAITESANAELIGMEATGTIQSVIAGMVTTGPDGTTRDGEPALLVNIDPALMHASRAVSWIVVAARFPGHGPSRLLGTWSVVNVSRATGPEPPTVLHSEDMIAIALMKLAKGHLA
jgi:hypothetical protein